VAWKSRRERAHGHPLRSSFAILKAFAGLLNYRDMLPRRNIQVNEELAQNVLLSTREQRWVFNGMPLDVISYLDLSVPEEKLIFRQTFLYGAFAMAAWNILHKERSASNINILSWVFERLAG
jgi:hypothetical protein